jgi:hypothetical protein
MANGFETDYSFLNLPEMGSAVRDPIELPSFEPVDYLSNIDFYAPRTLPEVDLVAPSPVPLSEQENLDLLSQARPFEDTATLGRFAGERMAEVERFFGEQVNGLQNNIQDLENAKQGLIVERDQAIDMQDSIRQQLAEEQIQALNEQQARLQAELEQAVAEAEARGIDAVAAAEAKAAEELQQVTSGYEGQINEINQALADVTAERDQAIAEQDTIRAQAADEQAQALESQRSQLLAEREGLLGQRDTTIADLQAQIAALQETPVVEETIPVVEETIPVVEEPIVEQPIETIQDVIADEDLGVVTEQPDTPFDQYLRDQEEREMTIDLGGGLGTVAVPVPSMEQLSGIAPQIPNIDAIQKGIEDLYGRVTAGGAKPEDFILYQPPTGMPTPEPTPPPPAGNMLYAGGSPGLYRPGGKFGPGVELPFPNTKTAFAGGGLVDMIQMRLNRI